MELMNWFNSRPSELAAYKTAVDFLAKKLGVFINLSPELDLFIFNQGQSLAREMDTNSPDRPRGHVYSVPDTLVGEFNALIKIFDRNESKESLNVICEAIIIAFHEFRGRFNGDSPHTYVKAPTELLHSAQKKLNLPGIDQ